MIEGGYNKSALSKPDGIVLFLYDKKNDIELLLIFESKIK